MTTNQTIDGVPLAELKFDDRLFHVSKTWKSCGRGWVKFICDEGDGCVRVRCENGAVPTVKLSNLQTLAVTDEQELAEFYDELSNGGALARRALTHIKALHMANKPATQLQGVPVAIVNSVISRKNRSFEIEVLDKQRLHIGTKLYTEQPAQVAPTPINYGALDPVERLAVCRGEVAPVAVVMPPKRKTQPFTTINRGSDNYIAGWNACLDELKRLNPSL